MSEEEFTALSHADKWRHIKETMDYIAKAENAYSLRTRFNPHHPKEQKQQERYSLRIDQYQRWAHVKNLYAEHRDALANTLENPEYEQCKSILERIFSTEVDDALRSIIGE